jgi:hypothetical protein
LRRRMMLVFLALILLLALLPVVARLTR